MAGKQIYDEHVVFDCSKLNNKLGANWKLRVKSRPNSANQPPPPIFFHRKRLGRYSYIFSISRGTYSYSIYLNVYYQYIIVIIVFLQAPPPALLTAPNNNEAITKQF